MLLLGFGCISSILVLTVSLRFTKIEKWRAFAAYFLCVFVGAFQIAWNEYDLRSSRHNGQTYCQRYYIAQIKEEVLLSKKSRKVTAQLYAFYNDSMGKWVPYKEKVAIYLQKSPQSENLLPGDNLIVRAGFKDIEYPYSEYMQKKQIYRSAYLPDGKWTLYKDAPNGMKLKRSAVVIRQKLERFFDDSVFTTQERGVAKALLLGDNSEMDKEVQRTYRTAGVVHVLCVSGMHLGIVAYVISAFFSFLKGKRQKFIRFFIVCLFLWFYAYITGLSPSVCRAACMFTFAQAGFCFGRRTSIYRSLVLSAWVLLLISPQWLFNVGFQLSYLAVVGIVTFVPKRYPAFIDNRRWLKKVIAFSFVSIAAQCATSPICMYYFHSFPVYFWLGNAIVSPLSSVLLPVGLIACIISLCGPFLSAYLAQALHFGIALMNGVVAQIDKLPVATPQVPFTACICILCYILMCLAVKAAQSRDKKYLHFGLGTVLGIVLLV